MRDVEGRVVVVTGGARGIGLATARRLLAERAVVALWDPRVEEVRDRLMEEFPGATLHLTAVDVRVAREVTAAADNLVNATGRIDILINNAGINVGRQPTVELSRASWQSVLETNLTGALHCVQAVVPHMTSRGWGRIINVSSVLAEYGYPEHAPYVASKAAIAGVTRSWAREFGHVGITVNAVRPGYIRTSMNEAMSSDVVEQVVAATPLGRIGTPEDVAALFLWLCSDDASFITGAVIPVDGGLMV